MGRRNTQTYRPVGISDVQNRWRRGCVVGVASIILVMSGLCASLGFGVHAGSVSPQWFDTEIGTLRLIGYTTWNSSCPPFTGCDPSMHESYVIWVMVDQQRLRILRFPIEQ